MPTPRERQQEARRLADKSLRSQLRYRFLHDYGFEKGRLIVEHIIDDILDLMAQYYAPDQAPQPNQIIYTAAHHAATHTRGKTIADTALQAVRLTMIDPQDTADYERGTRALWTARVLRWVHEAAAQGALLTTTDLALLAARSPADIERSLCDYERATGQLLPLRGTVHDCSGKLTHKARIVTCDWEIIVKMTTFLDVLFEG